MTCIGDYYHPDTVSPARAENADVGATGPEDRLYFCPRKKRRFVERKRLYDHAGVVCWDFKTGNWVPKREVWKGTAYAHCGPVCVVTNMGVYRFDEEGSFTLETCHPGVSVADIREQCGFDLNTERLQGETVRPTYRELFVLREFVDPNGSSCLPRSPITVGFRRSSTEEGRPAHKETTNRPLWCRRVPSTRFLLHRARSPIMSQWMADELRLPVSGYPAPNAM